MKKLFTLLAIAMLSSVFTLAQNYCPDPNFGTNGEVIHHYGANYNFYFKSLVQSDGKIVSAGSTQAYSADFNVLIDRHNADGTPDMTFNGTGFATFDAGFSSNDEAYSLALYPGDKYILGGRVDAGGYQDILIMRVNNDGTLDNTFNGNGIFMLDVAYFDDFIYDIAVQPDGKIVACGYSMSSTSQDMLVIRINSDGSIDNTFDGDGILTITPGTGENQLKAIDIQSDGKIVVGGFYSGTSNDIYVARLNTDGSFDMTFNGMGYLMQNLSGYNDEIKDIKIVGDTVIYAAGNFFDNPGDPYHNSQYLLARIKIDGTFDTNFSDDGRTWADIGGLADNAYALDVQPDGKILVGGIGWTDRQTFKSKLGIVRFNPDGNPDNTFGEFGVFAPTLDSDSSQFLSLNILPDGSFIASGAEMFNGVYDASIVKFDVCPCIVNIPDANFKAALVANPAINTNSDGEIQCSEASAYTGDISINSLGIYDLTGIEAFTLLDTLYCGNNNLTNIDLTANANLIFVFCNDNQLTNIDLSHCPNLSEIYCSNNNISILDLSLNLNLSVLTCDNNQLTGLNLKNGNNLSISFINATNNSGLTCIQVDDAVWSTNNWTNIDTWASFSEDCNSIIITPFITNSICNGSSDGAIDITVTGGTAPYTYAWSNLSGLEDLTGLVAGTYTVTVTDAASTTKIDTFIVTEPSQLFAVTTVQTNESCYGTHDGSVTGDGMGGVSPYTLAWSTGQNTPLVSGLAQGSYGLTVTDANGCTASTTYFIMGPSQLVLTPSSTNATCGSADGTASVSVSGGTSPYSYLWSNTETTASISGLSAQAYNVTVTDANNCTVSTTIIVNNTGGPSAFISGQTNISCFGGNNGSATLTVSGGTPNYEYTWSSGYSTINDPSTTSTATGLSAGTYTVTCMDLFGCSGIASVTITQPVSPLSVSINTTNISCFGMTNGTAVANAVGGTTPYTYLWSNSTTSQAISGLGATIYGVTVSDAHSCTATANTTITQPASALSASITKTNVLCFGQATGAADLTVAGGTTPYSYNWSNSATTQDLTGIPAGTYTVTITDNNSCTFTSSTTITQPASVLTSSITGLTNVPCYGNSTGAINITVSGGTIPYSYNWGGGVTTEDRTGLSAGTYSVTITDANSCTTTISATITEPSQIAISGTVTDENAGNDGAIDITVTGGTSPYMYNWSNSAATQDITGLAANTYTVTVTDANACTITKTFSVNSSSCNILVNAGSDMVICSNQTASLSGSVSGNTTTGTWTTSGTGSFLPNETTLSATYTPSTDDMNNGYAYLVLTSTNNGGCAPEVDTVLVTVFAAPTAYAGGNQTTSQNTVNLTGSTTNSSGCIWSSSGDGGFSNNSIINPVYTLGTNDMVAGTVTLTITASGNGPCGNATDNMVITYNPSANQPPVLYDQSYSVSEDGVLSGNNLLSSAYDIDGNNIYINTTPVSYPTLGDVTINGDGTFTYSPFANINGTDSFSFSACDDGSPSMCDSAVVTITINPVNDAPYAAEDSYNVNQNSIDNIFDVLTNDTDPENDALTLTSILINPSHGNAVISGNTVLYTPTIDYVGYDTMAYTMRDGFIFVSNYVYINVLPSGSINLSMSTTNTTCFGSCDGTATVTATGGSGSYTYLWSSGHVTQTATGLCQGIYTVTVNDGITNATSNVTITQPTELIVTILSHSNESTAGACDGAISTSVSGGTTPYSYLWSNSSTESFIDMLCAGTYTFTVTDANSCTATISDTISSPFTCTMYATFTSVIDATCFGGNDANGTITVVNGTAPFNYEWSDGYTVMGSTIPTSTNTALTAGVHYVTVTDDNGCTYTVGEGFGEPTELLVQLTNIQDETSPGSCDGSISISVTGGTTPYSYLWSDASTSDNATNLCAGTYTVTVTDGNSCSAGLSEIINSGSTCTMSSTIINQTNVNCYGENTGSATVKVIGGTPDYEYAWSNGTLLSGVQDTTNTVNGLYAGTYTVTITDMNSCTATASVTITENSPITATAIVTNVSSYGGSDGSIDVTVSGATPPYTFSWSNMEATEDLNNIPAGMYYLTIFDDYSCKLDTSFEVTEPASVISLTYSVTNVSCNGLADGAIDITATGGQTPYSYAWSNTATIEDLTNIPAGTYTVTVTDANSDFVIETITVTEPLPITTSIIGTNVSCYGLSDGSINLSVTGGTIPYTYTWSNGQTSQDLFNIAGGNYDVTVTDQNNCSALDSYMITEPGQIIATVNTTPESCSGYANGSATVSVTGGNSPYSYYWASGQTSASISGLTSGNYLVTVTDSNGCYANGSGFVDASVAIELNYSITQINCNISVGEISLSVTGGTQPYSYNWSNGSINDTISGLVPGDYTVTVTDQNNCFVVQTFTIVQIPPITATVVKTPSSCDLSCNGTATLTVSGGFSPYSFLWSTGESSNPAVALCPGVNSVTITDANGCTKSYNVQIVPEPMSKINGVIQYSGGTLPVNAAKVELWKNDTNATSGKTKISEIMNVENGVFQFSNIGSGSYLVKVKVIEQTDYPNLLPTYYDSVHQWFDATPIILACNSTETIEVNMLEVPGTQNGNSDIHGKITVATTNKSILGEPIPGAQITLEQEPDDQPIVATNTNYLGEYQFQNIDSGMYSLIVDIPGFPQFETHTVTITDNDTSLMNLNFVVDTTSEGLGIYIDHNVSAPLVETNAFSLSVYPNPSKEVFTLDITLNQPSPLDIKLMDVTGKNLFTVFNGNKPKGNFKFVCDEKLVPGVYFLEIKSQSTVYIKKIVKQ